MPCKYHKSGDFSLVKIDTTTLEEHKEPACLQCYTLQARDIDIGFQIYRTPFVIYPKQLHHDDDEDHKDGGNQEPDFDIKNAAAATNDKEPLRYYVLSKKEEKRLLQEENLRLGFVTIRTNEPKDQAYIRLPNGKYAVGRTGKWKLRHLQGSRRYAGHDVVTKKIVSGRTSLDLFCTDNFLDLQKFLYCRDLNSHISVDAFDTMLQTAVQDCLRPILKRLAEKLSKRSRKRKIKDLMVYDVIDELAQKQKLMPTLKELENPRSRFLDSMKAKRWILCKPSAGYVQSMDAFEKDRRAFLEKQHFTVETEQLMETAHKDDEPAEQTAVQEI